MHVTEAMRTAAMTSRVAGRSAALVVLIWVTVGLALSMAAAPVAMAKGMEVGQVCTGTSVSDKPCHPRAMQSTPIDAVPLGCKLTSGDTEACGRRGYHEGAASAGTDGPAADVVSGAQAGAQMRNSGARGGAR